LSKIIILLKQSQQKSWNITNYWLGIFMKLWGSVQVYDGRYNEIYAGVWRNATLEYLQSITKKLLGALLFIVEFQLCPNKVWCCGQFARKIQIFSRAYNFTIRPLLLKSIWQMYTISTLYIRHGWIIKRKTTIK